MSEKLRRTTPCDDVVALDLNRPTVHNALDDELTDALREAVDHIASQPSTRAILIGSTAAGSFCAGADLSVSDAERRRVSEKLYALYERLITLPFPVIAAIDGTAVGGGAQLALAADVRLGSPRSRFRFVGPGHGLAVGPWALPSTVGRRGLELVLSQRFLHGEEAAALGVLDRAVDDPAAEALALARGVTALDPDAVRRAKEQVVSGERLVERLAEERAGNAAFDGAARRTP